MRYIYGYVNCVFYNRQVEGDRVWFKRRRDRDAALERLRSRAAHEGLGAGAARAGIYPVQRHVDSEVGRAFVQVLEDRGMLYSDDEN